MKTRLSILFAAIALFLPGLAFGQFSDSYNFLKAVRERDGNKATEFVSRPGSVIIDTRDPTNGETALHIVTRERDLNWLAFLLSRNAKPDIRDGKGNTPLMVAAQIGFVEGAQALLRRRASVDLANGSGETPLIRAVQNRDAPMVRTLLLAGANPNKADTAAGLSARDYAARDRRSANILKLIEDTKPEKAAAGTAAGPKL
jgi:ankyrin repeat protein